MKGRKGMIAGVLVGILCLSLWFPVVTGAADVCFTAVNDRVLPLTDAGMPIWYGGFLYVPYTTFDQYQSFGGSVSDSELGIFSSYSRSENTVTIYDARHILEFHIGSGTARDILTGSTYKTGAVLRDGVPYVPVYVICSHFGMKYSYLSIPQGNMLRIKNSAVVLNDSQFVDAAENLLNKRLREYEQSLMPVQPEPKPEPKPETPAVPVEPSPKPTPEPERVPVDTYLSFRCEQADALESIMFQLELLRNYAMFYLSPDVIEQRPDLVVQILGRGHGVGLLAWGESLQETEALLERGEQALRESAFCRTATALVPERHEQQVEELGWICWDTTLELEPGENTGANYYARTTLNRLNGRTRDTYLTMLADGNGARVLATLLQSLKSEGYDILIPLETNL